LALESDAKAVWEKFDEMTMYVAATDSQNDGRIILVLLLLLLLLLRILLPLLLLSVFISS
jgi:hypothetical protein